MDMKTLRVDFQQSLSSYMTRASVLATAAEFVLQDGNAQMSDSARQILADSVARFRKAERGE